jgi:site-specific DNA-methyltransferase (adenine-specific)/site-specific DNA-methyltransferase (cytosine-N4-specific)
LFNRFKDASKRFNRSDRYITTLRRPKEKTYGGVSADKYVEWFTPIAKELLRVTKSSGSFVLNIKERAINGERHTYVIELILMMRKLGWLWTEEYIWHKKIVTLGNGQIALETLGKDASTLRKVKNSTCTKRK